MIDLRLGDWRTVLADVGDVGAVITDPPYSERTHEGALSSTGEQGVAGYAAWTPADAVDFCTAWAARCRGWMFILSDDVLGPIMRDHLDGLGRRGFPLLPVLQHMPQIRGDGPGSPGCFAVVSRPRGAVFSEWGSLPCWYEAPRDGTIVRGGKPLGLMLDVVRDYSRAGDRVVDPCAGGGTTLIAADALGRHAIGAEMDPVTFAVTSTRIRDGTAAARLQAKGRAFTPSMFPGGES